MQLVEVSEERRYERPVGIDEPEAALQQADDPEADGYVGKEETVRQQDRGRQRRFARSGENCGKLWCE